MKTKKLVAAAAVAATLCVTIGGSLAWLTDVTEEAENVFTVGDVDIDLDETTTDYKMVPGNTIEKDPTVTVTADSEDCYVFVKVKESANLDTYISYEIADGWTQLDGVEGVYYREVLAADETREFSVLSDDVVTVNNVNDKQMEAAETDQPTLTFTAYAIQKANMSSASDAWSKLSTQLNDAQ